MRHQNILFNQAEGTLIQMIAERLQQGYSSAKYYQFYTVATILEHVIDCFHTIVSDETNPYHPPLSWLTKKQIKPPKDELFLDLIDECSTPSLNKQKQTPSATQTVPDCGLQLSTSIKTRLEKCSVDLRRNIVSTTKDGCSPLFIACKFGHYDIAKYLLDYCDANIEQRGCYDALGDHHIHLVTPIWVAAVSGNINVVKLLIEYGANINSLSDSGSTPLRSVCFLCRDDEMFESENNFEQDIFMDIVKILVEKGADVMRANYIGGTCLINSLHNFRLTKYILENGANVNASDNQSKTALHYAIEQGRLQITKLLLSHGADPMINENSCDDALQLCCLGGHEEIFNYLTNTIKYSKKRLSDAYKLMGSSILELHYDLSKVRHLWDCSLKVVLESDSRFDDDLALSPLDDIERNGILCDIRRSIAFGDINEFRSRIELQSMSADDFRIQSLAISERILGSNHRETLQRLLYRGTFYINSLRPDRCIDLWIYALELRLRFEPIFLPETIFTAEAITKLFLDLLSQQQMIKYRDVYSVLTLLVDQLTTCRVHLSFKPVYRLHEDIYDLLLSVIVNLLFVLNHVTSNSNDKALTRKLIDRLVIIKPRTSNGSSLIHVCIVPVISGGEIHKFITPREHNITPLVKLINLFIDSGLEVDSTNHYGLSALQVLCLTSMRASEKRIIANLLIENGAHVDRKALIPEQGELIKQALKDAGINIFQHTTLACLAARKVTESRINYEECKLVADLNKWISIH